MKTIARFASSEAAWTNSNVSDVPQGRGWIPQPHTGVMKVPETRCLGHSLLCQYVSPFVNIYKPFIECCTLYTQHQIY